MRCLKLVPWIAVHLATIAKIQPARAEYLGVLPSDRSWVLGITHNPNEFDIPAAVTVYAVGRNVEVIGVITAPSGQTTSQVFPKPGRANRIMIEVDLPPGGSGTIFVNGAVPTTFESVRRGDTFRVVFDVE